MVMAMIVAFLFYPLYKFTLFKRILVKKKKYEKVFISTLHNISTSEDKENIPKKPNTFLRRTLLV